MNEAFEIEIARRYPAYPAYRESRAPFLGALPEHWEVRRLKTIASVWLSNVDKKSVEGEQPVKLCNYTDVYYNERILPGLEFMPATAAAEQVRRFALRKGDVLITKDSESWMDIAVPAVVTEDMPEVLCGYHLALIRPRETLCDGRFLARAFSAVRVREQFHIEANGITRFGLSGNVVQVGCFALPRLEEQVAIANFLDRETIKIDALIGKKKRLIELLQEKRAALITRSVTQGLDRSVRMKDSGVEWLGQIPSHWQLKRFKHCCRITEGQVDPEDELFLDRILIAPNHVESGTGRVLFTETASEQGAISGKYVVRAKEVIYSKIRPALNKVCISEGDWLFSADMYPISPSADILPEFLLYFVLSDPFVRLMVDESMRVAMPKVNRETLERCPIVLPPLEEQHAIATWLNEQATRISLTNSKLQTAIGRLLEYRSALVSAAVTGKIDVREAA